MDGVSWSSLHCLVSLCFLVVNTKSIGGYTLMSSINDTVRNCSTCRVPGYEEFENLKRIKKIKDEILRRLGINQMPVVLVTLPLEVPTLSRLEAQKDKGSAAYDYELSDMLSFSEPADNFTDRQNIIQFQLAKDKQGRQLHVKSADLLIRVKYPPKHSEKLTNKPNSRSMRRMRKTRKKKLVDLEISTVTTDGQPGEMVAAVKSHLRKTKWLKLSLPHALVQRVVDSSERKLQVFIRCNGCRKGAELVLVQRRRKRTLRLVTKFNKRRPRLFLHTRVRTVNRQRRSAQVRACSVDSRDWCCKTPLVVDFESIGWSHWILSPKRYRTAFCDGNCAATTSMAFSGSSPLVISDDSAVIVSPSANPTIARTASCLPVRQKPLTLVYYSEYGVILQSVLPNMIVTKCGCRRRSITDGNI